MTKDVNFVDCTCDKDFNSRLEGLNEPLLMKGLVDHWPVVKKAKHSDVSVMEYLKSHYNGRPTIICKSSPEKHGLLAYNQNLTRLDYESYKGRIDDVLDLIRVGFGAPKTHNYYLASANIDTYLPGFNDENTISISRALAEDPPTASIWIGGESTASCHFDALDNIACCVAGSRRFTLFPPDQVSNLYPGPLDPTPGGQAISLVNFENPDLDQFPRFSAALDHSFEVNMEPGDALFLPSMWWHHVKALSPFNILVNYWWNEAAKHTVSGMNAIYMAMLAVRDKPEHERKGWKALFDYYIFDGSSKAVEKIPAEARGFLDTLDDDRARMLRALLINKLNR